MVCEFTVFEVQSTETYFYNLLILGFGVSKIIDLVYFSNSNLNKLQPKLIFVYVKNDITLPKVAAI